jgi:hypothetical protein
VINRCSHGTLPHFGLQRSQLNICYYNQDLYSRLLHHGSPQDFYATATPSYLFPSIFVNRLPSVSTFQRHPFSGLLHHGSPQDFYATTTPSYLFPSIFGEQQSCPFPASRERVRKKRGDEDKREHGSLLLCFAISYLSVRNRKHTCL